MLLSCFLISILTSRQNGNKWQICFYVLLILLGAFLGRHSIIAYIRIHRQDKYRKKVFLWIIGYGFILLFGCITLIFYYKRWFLLAIGSVVAVLLVISIILEQNRKGMSIIGELIGVIGLTFAYPTTAYSIVGTITIQTIGLWILLILFFSGSVFHVRYLARNRKQIVEPFSERWQAGLPSVLYHIIILVVASLLSLFRLIPVFAAITLIPVTIKALWAVAHQYNKPIPIRRIGFIELAHTLLFLILIILTSRLGD